MPRHRGRMRRCPGSVIDSLPIAESCGVFSGHHFFEMLFPDVCLRENSCCGELNLRHDAPQIEGSTKIWVSLERCSQPGTVVQVFTSRKRLLPILLYQERR